MVRRFAEVEISISKIVEIKTETRQGQNHKITEYNFHNADGDNVLTVRMFHEYDEKTLEYFEICVVEV